jgi:hypothetical protein
MFLLCDGRPFCCLIISAPRAGLFAIDLNFNQSKINIRYKAVINSSVFLPNKFHSKSGFLACEKFFKFYKDENQCPG